MELRQYQQKAKSDIRESIRSGNKSILVHAPTGSGKTIIAADIAKSTVEKGNNFLFLVDRRDLVFQAKDRFESFGIGKDVGVIMSGEEHDLSKKIQICTRQTYHKRIQTNDPSWMPWFHDAHVVVVDECHNSLSKSYLEILEHYKSKIILGLTATPARSDGQPLGKIYQDIVTVSSIKDLTDSKFLLPFIYYAPETYDLSKITISRGDYEKKQLGDWCDRPRYVGNIYEQWAKYAAGRQTICFAVNVKHSKHIKELFERRGVAVAHIDAKTKKEEREEIYGMFESGEIQYLTNVGIATEGFDMPCISCVQIVAPTMIVNKYIQMCGRGSRPYHDQTECVIIDHTGCVARHGFLDEEREWSLDGKEKKAIKERKQKTKDQIIIECDMCRNLFKGVRRCPVCGYEIKDYGKKIAAIEEAELKAVGKTKKKEFTRDEKERWFAMFDYYRRERGYKPGWAANKYKERFGVWPRNLKEVPPLKPNIEFNNYMKYLAIRWAKSKNRQSAFEPVNA